MAAFDTLRAVDALTRAGLDGKQARAIVETMTDSMHVNLATKADLAALELRLTVKLGGVVAAVLAGYKLLESVI
jgi:hypothetical protein